MNKKTYLICCIFGGWFGLHYFVQKNFFKGMLYLFSGGIFLIGWIYDIFLVYKQYINSNLVSHYSPKTNYVNGYFNKNGKFVNGYLRKK